MYILRYFYINLTYFIIEQLEELTKKKQSILLDQEEGERVVELSDENDELSSVSSNLSMVEGEMEILQEAEEKWNPSAKQGKN